MTTCPNIAEDFINAGYIKTFWNAHEEAIQLYKKALAINPNQVYALNNIGYSLSYGLNKHEEAIEFLNKAISIDPKYAHPYSTRGFAKIKLGGLEGGLDDINHSMQLDDSNSHSHMNLGIYYLEKGETRKMPSRVLQRLWK